jgi:hypothetical protein
MAIGKTSDFKIYDELMHTGYTETVQQFTDAFNEGSNGAIALVSEEKLGEYEKEAFYEALSAPISRQDITSVAAVTDRNLTQDENIRVKLHRKFDPTAVTKKQFKMIGRDPDEFFMVLGAQYAKDAAREKLDTGLLAARVALANVSAVLNDVTSASITSVTHTNLLRTIGKFGDAHDRIVAFVMHSTQFFDLGVQAIADQIDTIASGIIQVFNVPGFGRPFIVTDSASLIATADTPDSYFVLGLSRNAIQLIESETPEFLQDEVSGLEQIVMRYQGEYAYNLGVKGFKWDTANGAGNPDATALATASNWDRSMTSDKDLAGVVLKCQAAS